MSWNGAGVFNRLFSWQADAAAGIDISSTRMDSDTNDITANGLGNSLTRDGQGQPTANLPMNNFRHTGAGNGVLVNDYSTMAQVQNPGVINWAVASGTSDALTVTYAPALTTLVDGQICYIRATAANATTTPTFAPNGLTAQVITKAGGAALAAADIGGALNEYILRYNLANTRWELLNPSLAALTTAITNAFSTGDVKLTLKTVPDTGWLMFDDGTFGSATSGSSNSNNAANQALFLLLFANVSDTFAPLFTSAGAGTTRGAQGTAAAAWAANCRMSLTKTLGRALAISGSGSGLTARTLGQTLGEETHLSTLAETPTGITSANTASIALSVTGTNISFGSNGAGATGSPLNTANSVNSLVSSGTIAIGNAAVTSNNTGGTAHNNMQPTTFMKAMVKQ